MKKQNRALILLLAAAVTLIGITGAAAARGGHSAGPRGMGPCASVSPEADQIIQKSHAAMAPLFMELQAKRQELTAKIYSGADEATIKGLISQIATLQNRLVESGAAMHQQLAKAGVPLNAGMSNCPGWGGRGDGMGYHGAHGKGYHGGRGYHGGHQGGYHGGYHGGCPYWKGQATAPEQAR